MSVDDPLIRVEGLKKYYESESDFFDRILGRRKWVKAVDGIDLEIDEGETLGLVGESGCGKSTVGRTLLQLDEATEGSIYYRGDDITEYNNTELRDLRREMQLIFQNPQSSLNPRLTVSDIISEALKIHDIGDPETWDQQVKDLLETVGLNASHANRYPHEFSGGQLQRIGIARALAVEPDFIVCDEPVSALDVSVQAQILNLLEELQAEYGISYLFIAHDLSVVEHIADRIAVMYLGKIVEIGTPEELFSPPQHPYTEALLSAIPEPDPLWDGDRILLDGTVPSPIDPPAGCSFHTRCPRVIPPKEFEFEQDEWRAVHTLRVRVEDRELSVEQIEENATQPVETALKDRFDIPRSMSDPRAETIVDEAIEELVAGEFEAAEQTLSETFVTPCTVHEPELQPIENGRASCHLFDQQYQDGSVDEELAENPTTGG